MNILMNILWGVLFNGILYATGVVTESQSSHPTQQAINFFGRVTTQEGNIYSVDNITIEGRIDRIGVFEIPHINISHELEISLPKNPVEEFARINLSLKDITYFNIPQPHQIWFYQKKPTDRKVRYIEVHVTKKNVPDIQKYLMYISHENQIAFFNRLSDGQPQPMTLPLLGLKELYISGQCAQEKDAPSCALNNGKIINKQVFNKTRSYRKKTSLLEKKMS